MKGVEYVIKLISWEILQSIRIFFLLSIFILLSKMSRYIRVITMITPYPAKLIYLNFQPLEVVSRYCDPQPEVVWLKITHICLI